MFYGCNSLNFLDISNFNMNICKSFENMFLNNDNIEEYNNSLESLKDLFKESVDKLLIIDTGFINMQDVSVDVASQIMIEMRKKYIESFKEEYNLK